MARQARLNLPLIQASKNTSEIFNTPIIAKCIPLYFPSPPSQEIFARKNG
jgi:hypothetical protein